MTVFQYRFKFSTDCVEQAEADCLLKELITDMDTIADIRKKHSLLVGLFRWFIECMNGHIDEVKVRKDISKLTFAYSLKFDIGQIGSYRCLYDGELDDNNIVRWPQIQNMFHRNKTSIKQIKIRIHTIKSQTPQHSEILLSENV